MGEFSPGWIDILCIDPALFVFTLFGLTLAGLLYSKKKLKNKNKSPLLHLSGPSIVLRLERARHHGGERMCVQRLPLREVLLALLAAILPQADDWEVVEGGLCFCRGVNVCMCVCLCFLGEANVSS